MRNSLNGLELAIGQRVSIRIRISGGYQDLLGVLESVDALSGTVRLRDSSIITFSKDQVFAWREVKPITEVGKGLPLSLRTKNIELAGFHTWQSEKIEEYGAWIIRIDKGKTLRANSVLVLGEPPHSYEIAVAKVVADYKGSNIPPVFMIPAGLSEPTENYLLQHGWEIDFEVLAMIGDSEKITAPVISQQVSITTEPSDQWLALEHDEDLRQLFLRSPSFYINIFHGSQLIARGRIGIADGWGILTRIFVVETHRRQKLGESLVRIAAEVARNHNCRQLALHVDPENISAISLYRKIGFSSHHKFRFYKMQ